jgi:hypothetical protein
MIQPGIMAPLTTEYIKMTHASLLPEICSNIFGCSALFEDNLNKLVCTIFFC